VGSTELVGEGDGEPVGDGEGEGDGDVEGGGDWKEGDGDTGGEGDEEREGDDDGELVAGPAFVGAGLAPAGAVGALGWTGPAAAGLVPSSASTIPATAAQPPASARAPVSAPRNGRAAARLCLTDATGIRRSAGPDGSGQFRQTGRGAVTSPRGPRGPAAMAGAKGASILRPAALRTRQDQRQSRSPEVN
jgi:hypothetical protein